MCEFCKKQKATVRPYGIALCPTCYSCLEELKEALEKRLKRIRIEPIWDE